MRTWRTAGPLFVVVLSVASCGIARGGVVRTSSWLHDDALGEGVNEIKWMGDKAKPTILLTTRDGALFRSASSGSSWRQQFMRRSGHNDHPEDKVEEDEFPRPGESCDMSNPRGPPRCDRGHCNMHEKKCYETCFPTETRYAHQIPRRDKYFCNYGEEDPQEEAEQFLPQAGQSCKKGKGGKAAEEACAIGTHCVDGTCVEICVSTATRSFHQIPLNDGVCDYGDETPLQDLAVGRPGERCALELNEKDDLDAFNDFKYKRWLNGDWQGLSKGCRPGAWCHDHTLMCWESCYDTPTRKAQDIPRKDTYWCDYGTEVPKKPDEHTTLRWNAFEKIACGATEHCGQHAYCKNGQCYEICYNTKTRYGDDIPMKADRTCDYGDEKPQVYSMQTTSVIKEDAAKRVCPGFNQKGRLPCQQGEVLCEDVYAQQCGFLSTHTVDIRGECHAMGCKLKDIDPYPNWFKVLKVDPHPKYPNYVFLTGQEQTHWSSFDDGKSYETSFSKTLLRGFTWHPTERWAMAYEPNIACMQEHRWRCYGNLVVSTDGGKQWERVLSNVKYPNYAWLPGDHEDNNLDNHKADMKDRVCKTTCKKDIMAVQHSSDRGPAKSWDTELNFVYSDQFFQGKSTSVLLPRGNNFAVIGKYIFVAVASTNKEVTLWVSHNNAATFELVKMPTAFAERSYGILHTAEQSCFVIVRSGHENAQYGSMYQTDESGTKLALSLENAHYERGRTADLLKVQSVDGVYLVNTVMDANNDVGDEAMSDNGDPLRIQTKVSFDKGATWRLLNPPPHTWSSPDSKFACRGSNCHLHLFFKGNPQGFSPVYTTSSSTGFIMAQGVVSEFMEESVAPDEIGLFFSRDAGHTWWEVRRGASVYEFGNHGSLIVVAAHKQVTSEVQYSWNEGKDWKFLKLPTALEVSNIRTDTDAGSLYFLVVGETSAGRGAAIGLDFTELHERECKGVKQAGSKTSDYENWSPRGKKLDDGDSSSADGDALFAASGHSKCVLGRAVYYTRRKQLAQCHNPQVSNRKKVVKNCQCSREDFECAPGFELDKANKCVASAGAHETMETDMLALYRDPSLLNKMCDKYPDQDEMFAISGYRRIPGDTCVGGVNDLSERRMDCPNGADGSSGGIFTALALVIFVVAVAAVGWHLYVKGAASVGATQYSALGHDEDEGMNNAAESVFEDDFALAEDGKWDSSYAEGREDEL